MVFDYIRDTINSGSNTIVVIVSLILVTTLLCFVFRILRDNSIDQDMFNLSKEERGERRRKALMRFGGGGPSAQQGGGEDKIDQQANQPTPSLNGGMNVGTLRRRGAPQSPTNQQHINNAVLGSLGTDDMDLGPSLEAVANNDTTDNSNANKTGVSAPRPRPEAVDKPQAKPKSREEEQDQRRMKALMRFGGAPGAKQDTNGGKREADKNGEGRVFPNDETSETSNALETRKTPPLISDIEQFVNARNSVDSVSKRSHDNTGSDISKAEEGMPPKKIKSGDDGDSDHRVETKQSTKEVEDSVLEKKAPTSQETKQRRPAAPPAQLLCEALSVVCGTEVTVEKGQGSWGGEGWVKKRKVGATKFHSTSANSAPKLPKIVLPLVEMQQPSQEAGSEWSQIESALESVISSPKSPFQGIIGVAYKKGGVATAASWHCKTHGAGARDAIDNILRVFGAAKENNETILINKQGLGQCLSVLSKHLARVIAQWLDKDISHVTSREQEVEDSDEEDLFSDDYNSSSAKAARAAHLSTTVTKTALAEMFELSSKPNAVLVLPKKLFSDIIAQSVDSRGLARALLKQAIDRLPSPDSTSCVSFDSIAKESAVVTHMMSNSVDVAMSLARQLKTELELMSLPPSGDAVELSSMLRPLFSLGGYTLPSAGFERDGLHGYRFYESLKTVEAFPLGYFDYSKPLDPSITKVIEEARSVMKHARTSATRVLGQLMRKNGGNGKQEMFQWLARLSKTNEMHSTLLQDQLLDGRDAVHQTLSSRPFLMGVALTVLELSGDLGKSYEKNGVDTFDARYLLSSNGSLVAPPDERRLVSLGDSTSDQTVEGIPRIYTGATEFFFLASALLRVSVFPARRAQEKYLQAYEPIFNHLSELAKAQNQDTRLVPERYKKIAAGSLGWKTLLDDREVMGRLIDFSILQLRYVADLSKSDGDALTWLPESMVKLPSQYIAHVATSFQTFLSPYQAEAAVVAQTIILGSKKPLSIQVQTELMRISGAFVRASVRREEVKQQRKHRGVRRRGGSGNDQDEDVFFDLRELEIYSSLDKNDHGVVVFASQVAETQLGPSLIKTFIAMEAVEGLDVERENHMHKNQVQSEIAELILRLWMHPSGKFKQSIATLPNEVLNEFFRSVLSAISMECDTVFQSIVDIRDVLESHGSGRFLSGQTKATLNSCYGRLPSFLGSLRRLFLLLSYLSQDESIALILGGGGGSDVDSASSDLGILVVSLLDRFTAHDGGTHPLVDFRLALQRSTNMASRQTLGQSDVKKLIDARIFARVEFGFDVSSLSHLLMALATRCWAMAAGNASGATTTLIDAITSHDDFDIRHFQAVYERLIVAPRTEKADEELMDGYVDLSVWGDQYKSPSDIGLEESARRRRFSSKQDQFTRSAIDGIAKVEQIKRFLNRLGKHSQSKKSNIVKSREEIIEMERSVLSGQALNDEGYTQYLEDWLVSSDCFSSETGAMEHFYRSNTKTNSLGKILLNDARKIHKNLPPPHPNASIFVCYAEERMDICKAMIVGATGTPYAMGLFNFDICYPQLYPNAPPMVHSMTTGGGQVRFSPNLYNDGKVCLSLLGTTGAGDESQRWNPHESSLAQVLLSIQSQILDVAEPYFAEGGGHGGLQHTAAGRKGSARYNNTLRLSTLRHAIIEPLKFPPKGFEDVTRRHFAMTRKRILVQAKLWTLEAKGTELFGRFERAYSELIVLLSDKKLASCEDWEEAEIGGSVFSALSPLPVDLEALRLLDQNTYNSLVSALGTSCNDDEDVHEDHEHSQLGEEIDETEELMLARALELSLLQNL